MTDQHLHAVVHDGDGPFALILHGALGSRSYWDDNLEALKTVCRPVVLELWGHGRSPSPEDPKRYEPEAYVEEDLARSGEGRMPGVAATESAVTTAIVEEIDLDNNTFKLREPDGEIRQYTARNPGNLRMAEVGDKVITTVTTSVVITVESRPAE